MSTASACPPGVATGVQMFNSSKYSDLTVTCGNDTYALHRAFICPRSAYFDAACEQGSAGASTSTIDLGEDDPQTVNRMLIYIYTNDYPDGAIPAQQRPSRPSTARQSTTLPPHLRATVELAKTSDTCSEDDKLMDNVLVYAIAEKYHLPELKTLAQSRVQALTRPDAAYTGVSDFSDVVKFAFESTPAVDNGLRDIFIKLCADYFPDVLVHEGLDTVIKSIAPLSFGILQSYSERKGQLLEQATACESDLREQLAISKAEVASAIDREKGAVTEKDAALAAKSILVREKDDAIKGCETARNQYTSIIKERNAAIVLKDQALRARDIAVKEKDEAFSVRTAAVRERDEATSERRQRKANFDEVMERTFQWQNCRNGACGRYFNGYLQLMSSQGEFAVQLRCRSCCARHDVGCGIA